jgi:hypothetical protein
METTLIQSLIASYFGITRQTIQDLVPKAIMHLLASPCNLASCKMTDPPGQLLEGRDTATARHEPVQAGPVCRAAVRG